MIHYRTVNCEGIEIFYREAGNDEESDFIIATWISNIISYVSQSHSVNKLMNIM